MAAPEKFSSEAMIDALRKTNGLVSLAAGRIGCAPKTIYQRAKTVAAVQQAIDDAREELVDIAELALRASVTDKQPWAVALVLKTLGKGRGYVERQEVAGVKDQPLEHKVTGIDYDQFAAAFAAAVGGRVADVPGDRRAEPLDSARADAEAGGLPEPALP